MRTGESIWNTQTSAALGELTRSGLTGDCFKNHQVGGVHALEGGADLAKRHPGAPKAAFGVQLFLDIAASQRIELQ